MPSHLPSPESTAATDAIPRSTRMRLATVVILATLLGAIVMVGSNRSARRHEVLREVDDAMTRSVAAPAQRTEGILRRYRRDVRFMTQLPPIAGIERAQRNGDVDPIDGSTLAAWRARLEQIFSGFLRTHADVSQLRYIGVEDGGRELVRVERRRKGIVSVARASLQRKADRYYFKAAVARAVGDIWVSEFDLNREQGRVEVPHRPTLRLATPIVDEKGAPFGVVVLNLDAAELLESVSSGASTRYPLYLVNARGDYLVHPVPQKRFGFDLGRRYRLQDEFSPIEGAAEFPALKLLRSQGQKYYVKTKAIELNPGDPDSRVEFVATASEQQIEAAVTHATIEQGGLAALLVGAMFGAFLVYRMRIQDRMRVLEQRNRLAAIVEGSRDAIIGVDTAGKIVDWNAGAVATFGYSANEALLKPLNWLLGDLAIEPSPPWTDAEVVCSHRDGRLMTVAVTRSAIHGANDAVVGMALILRDVTDDKARNQRITRLNEELEQQVHERTESLEVAKAEAEASSKAKGQFLANMTHEIRTPMNAILGTLQLLRGRTQGDAQRRYADTAETAARALLRTLNDILDYSKIEAGKCTILNEPFDLHQMLHEVGVILSASLGAKEIDLLFDIEPGLPRHIVGDAVRFQQVLLNLSSNALKFTSVGHVIISMQCTPLAGGRVSLLSSVLDTGIGMNEEQLSRVFESFEQAEGTTTRTYGGTGLGLTISRRLVQMMGGTLEVSSRAKRGSEFSFSIVCPIAHAQEQASSSRLELRRSSAVMLIDEPGIARDVTRRMLLGKNLETHCANNIAAARAAIDEQRNAAGGPGVLLVKARPGRVSFAVLAKSLMDLARETGLPTVAMASPVTQSELLASTPALENVVSFVSQPMTADRLLDALQEACARDHDSVPARPTDGPQRRRGRLRGTCILLVDDNALNQSVASELLRLEGADVTVASNGHEAIDRIKNAKRPFDVVLMDMHMPHMDGTEATRVIRNTLGLDRHELPVIAMTANTAPADREACLDSGMNDHVGKPFYIDELVGTINQHVALAAHPPKTPQQTPAPGSTPPDAFDFSTAIARFGDNEAIFATAVDHFCARYQSGLDAWLARVRGDEPMDDDALRREIHSLKGDAAILGAVHLAALAADLEQQCRRGPPYDGLEESLERLSHTLSNAIVRLRAELRTRLDEPPHAASGKET